MTAQAFDWNAKLPVDPQAEYQAVIRSLRRQRGFGILFVQCSPARGEHLIKEVQAELLGKKIGVLEFQQEIPNGDFYESVVTYFKQNARVDILFVQGLELSLLSYERAGQATGLLTGEERYAYSEKGVPRLLGNLNLRREKFRDEFSVCFVFLLPRFALKYLTRRAPDFFDWRSGVFELPTDEEIADQASSRLLSAGDYNQYLHWTQDERDRRHKQLQAWLDEPHQSPERKAELLTEQARLFLASQESELAIFCCDQALQYHPSHPNAVWQTRGLALFNLGRYQEALTHYDSALQDQPDDVETLISRGNTLDKLERYEEAIASYDIALKLQPNAYRAWYGRSYALMVLGRYEEAGHSGRIAVLTEALSQKPDDLNTLCEQATALNSIGWFNEALLSIEKAIALDPNCEPAWFQKGFALGELGKPGEAITAYDKVLELTPNSVNAFNNRAKNLNDLARYEEGVIDATKAIELQPNYDYAWNNRGWALLNLGRHHEALRDFDQALEINSFYFVAQNNRKSALEKLSTDERLNYYTEYLAKKPNDYETWFAKGLFLRGLGRYDEAVTAYDRAIATKPEYLSASTEWFQKGYALEEAGRREEAIAANTKVLELDPTEQAALNNRGNSLNSSGRYQEALTDLDKAVEMKPDDRFAWNNRGWALFNLGRYAEALVSLDKSLELDPTYLSAQTRRDTVLKKLSSEEQIAHYARQLADHPQSYRILVAYADVLRQAQKYEEAVSIYRRTLEIFPESYESQRNCAAVLLELGQFQPALLMLNQAVEADPNCAANWLQRGRVNLGLERWEGALADFEQYAKVLYPSSESWEGRADALTHLNRYEEAIDNYSYAFTIAPDKAHHAIATFDKFKKAFLLLSSQKQLDYVGKWLERGNILLNAKHYQEAVEHYDQALAVEPNPYNAWNRGIALHQIERYDEALKSYEQALQDKQDEPNIWLNQGFTLAHLRRDKAAIVSYEKALQLKQANGDRSGECQILIVLAALYGRCGKIQAGYRASYQAEQIRQELKLPIEDLPYPSWNKQLLRFVEQDQWLYLLTISIFIIIGLVFLPLLLLRLPFLTVMANYLSLKAQTPVAR